MTEHQLQQQRNAIHGAIAQAFDVAKHDILASVEKSIDNEKRTFLANLDRYLETVLTTATK